MKGKAAAAAPDMIEWEVVKTREAGEIYGARRAVGETFQAPESAVTFEHLEGLIRKVDAKPVKAGK